MTSKQALETMRLCKQWQEADIDFLCQTLAMVPASPKVREAMASWRRQIWFAAATRAEETLSDGEESHE
jgi:hypothetical protein